MQVPSTSTTSHGNQATRPLPHNTRTHATVTRTCTVHGNTATRQAQWVVLPVNASGQVFELYASALGECELLLLVESFLDEARQAYNDDGTMNATTDAVAESFDASDAALLDAVDSRAAQTRNMEDKKAIDAYIEAGIGFEALDAAINDALDDSLIKFWGG